MNDFKVGDKVRITSNGYADKEWIGVEGIVEGPGLFPNAGQYKVRLTKTMTTGKPVGYVANLGRNLELVETPFTFKDIQEGDTIRRTHVHKDGAKDTREGVAAIKGAYYWATADGSFILAYDSDNEGVTLELLNRPEPEPVKEVWEDAKVLTRQYAEFPKDTFVREDDGSWTIHYGQGDGTFKIEASENLNGYFEDAEVKVLAKS